jgi:hypothetical protein
MFRNVFDMNSDPRHELKGLPSRGYKSLSMHWMLGSTTDAASQKSLNFWFVYRKV